MAGPVLTGDPRNSFGYAIFCDDIRQETSGKVSLIGTYSGRMYLHGGDFPFLIPKFGMVFSYFEKHETAKGPVVLKIWFPGDEAETPSIEADLPIDEIRKKAEKDRSTKEPVAGGEFLRLDTHMVLTNVVLKEEGRIVARAFTEGGEEVRLGTLKVEKPKSP